ncbi:MAG: hypothetical protein QOK28_2022 [Actinomycetota bacterium]|jgi:hypothetical protein
MPRIGSIEQRQVEALAAQIEGQLGAAVDVPGLSSLTVAVSEITSVDRWRKAVRLVARRHGWRVRTGVSGGVAWATDLREPPEHIRRAMADQTVERLDAMTSGAGKPKLRRV